MCKYFVNTLSNGGGGGYRLHGLARIYLKCSYFTGYHAIK